MYFSNMLSVKTVLMFLRILFYCVLIFFSFFLFQCVYLLPVLCMFLLP